ncbi:MAG: Dynamin family protein [Desulfuromonas sp.]|uniref:dynamin family protein n=1 Tax=Desulfuromonas sp. TaxID=892 RepID=UPI000CB99561|nr:dynamin family protein [Desulfuromonas sp.]PLX82278.1 MAG: Dynamin family protein [Desulfuromonas sp.]
MTELPSGGTAIPPQEAEERDLAGLLERSAACLSRLGDDYADSRAGLESLQGRLAEGRFHLAVLGQFKRGKSTLLNALLGEDLLPTDILPVTAIPTFIEAGETLQVRVVFDGERPAEVHAPGPDRPLAAILADYVTEAGNPHNERSVRRVEIAHPADLLRRGVVLIDTPGVGSTLRHNTEAAHQVLPQCDAALFLVSPDPPLTEMELEYLGRIRDRLPRIFFLLNKVDFLEAGDLQASLQFLRENLERHGDLEEAPRIFPISARKALQSRVSGDESGWKSSGLQEVEEHLIDFLAKEKQHTLQAALARQACDMVDEGAMRLQLTLRSLELPLEDLQQRLDTFAQVLPEVEREQHAAADVLAGDRKRAIALLDAKVEEVRERARSAILPRVEEYLDGEEDPEEMEELVRLLMARETPPFFSAAMRSVGETVRKEATDLLTLNQQRSNRIIEKVRQTAAELFQVPYRAPAGAAAYTPFSPPSWSSEVWVSDMDPLGQRISRKLFSQRFRRRRTVKRLREHCRSLLNQNVEQISWTLRRSLDESFRHFDYELREQLEKTVGATRGAVEVALGRREAQARETAPDEARLKKELEELQAIRKALGACP